MTSDTSNILSFWFGAWPYDQEKAQEQTTLWFMPSDALDKEITDKFLPCVQQALDNNYPLNSLEDKLAYILLLDQFTRNIYRGKAQAFSGDQQSLDVCLELINSKLYETLPLHVAIFACMPLQHSEHGDIQQLSIETFSRLVALHGKPAENYLNYAQKHKAIIDQFSRYPHRNTALGRASTADEEAYLNDSGMRFGQ